jgi:hypothetical protein
MESVRNDPGLYQIYLRIPAGDEKKFEWICQEGANNGYFEFPTRYYRLKTEEELKQDKILVSEIKCDTIVATDRLMYYLDSLPKELHKYFDFTIILRSDDKTEERLNASLIHNLTFGGFSTKNILRNNSKLELQ